MKKTALLTAVLLLLTGCGGERGREARDLALEVRSAYLAAEAIAASAELTADYGQRVCELGLDFSWQREGDTLLTVTAPELLSGITVRIRAGETLLEYDGASLETGELPGSGLSPLELLPALLEHTCQTYMAACVMEDLGESPCLRVDFRDPEVPAGRGTEAAIWFDPATFAMVRGEVLSGGGLVAAVTFSEFTLA